MVEKKEINAGETIGLLDIKINLDFDLLYPEKEKNCLLNWNSFYEKLIRLKPTRDGGVINLKQSLQNIEEYQKLPAQIKILAHVVPPRGILLPNIRL